MLSSITPLGERGRHRPWWPTAAALVAGSAVGGAALGLVCGGLGVAMRAMSPAVLAVCAAVVAVLLAALQLARRLPSWHRQVDERWLTAYRGWVVGLGFGVQLGAAVLTIVPAVAIWLVLVVAVATGSWSGAALIGLTFGLVRALPILATMRVTDAPALHALHQRLDRLRRPVAWTSTATAAVAVAGVVVIAAAQVA